MALTLITFSSGQKIKSSDFNANFAAINAQLFALKNVNIAADAAIVDTKLAQIVTADKISGAALVSKSLAGVKGQFFWGFPGVLTASVNLLPVQVATADLDILAVQLLCKTAPTGGSIIVDINRNGTSIFSTLPTITNGSTSGGGSAVLSTTTLTEGHTLTVDIDQVGGTVAGADLSVILKCRQKVPQ